MSEELLYTSAPKGLKQGSRGFCTVVASAGMTPQMATLLESLSGYRHLAAPGDPSNPVVWRHLTANVGGRSVHVLSRVADAGTDYSGRTNKLAHHLAVPANELNAAGPAWTQRQPATHETVWNGETCVLSAGRPLPTGAAGPRPCEVWYRLTGDAGWGGVLAQRLMDGVTAPIPLIYSATTDPLALLAETIALLPESMRWRATYTTLHTSVPPGVACAWRFVLDGTAEAEALRKRPDLERIDLTGGLAAPPPGPWVEAARTGVRPAGRPAAPQQAPVGPAPPTLFDAAGAYDLALPDASRPLPPPPRRRRRNAATSDVRRPERSTSLIAVTAIALICLTAIFSLAAWSLWEPISEIARHVAQHETLSQSKDKTQEVGASADDASVDGHVKRDKSAIAANGDGAVAAQAGEAETDRDATVHGDPDDAEVEENGIEAVSVYDAPPDPTPSNTGRAEAESPNSTNNLPLFSHSVLWCRVERQDAACVAKAYFAHPLSNGRLPRVNIVAHSSIANIQAVQGENLVAVDYIDELGRPSRRLITAKITNSNVEFSWSSDESPFDPAALFAAIATDSNANQHVLLLREPASLDPLNRLGDNPGDEEIVSCVGGSLRPDQKAIPPNGFEFSYEFDVGSNLVRLPSPQSKCQLGDSGLQIVRLKDGSLRIDISNESSVLLKKRLESLLQDRRAWEQDRSVIKSELAAVQQNKGIDMKVLIEWFDRPFDVVVNDLNSSGTKRPSNLEVAWDYLQEMGILDSEIGIDSRRVSSRTRDLSILGSLRVGVGLIPSEYEITYPAKPVQPSDFELPAIDVVYSSTMDYPQAPQSPPMETPE